MYNNVKIILLGQKTFYNEHENGARLFITKITPRYSTEFKLESND